MSNSDKKVFEDKMEELKKKYNFPPTDVEDIYKEGVKDGYKKSYKQYLEKIEESTCNMNLKITECLKELVDSLFDNEIDNIESITVYDKLEGDGKSIDIDYIKNVNDPDKLLVNKIIKISYDKWKAELGGIDESGEVKLDELKLYLLYILTQDSYTHDTEQNLIVIKLNTVHNILGNIEKYMCIKASDLLKKRNQ